MFLLFPAATEEAISISNIYIPICFYYFVDYFLMVADYVNYLHSNMFLLFLVLFTVTFPCVIRIYIPICFYYFAILSNFFIFRFKIYIPICFYYFCRSRSETFLPGIFTFQYVSIISTGKDAA